MSLGELLMIGLVALIVIGPKRLPEAAEYLGRLSSKIMGFIKDVQCSFEKGQFSSKQSFDTDQPSQDGQGQTYEHQDAISVENKLDKINTTSSQQESHNNERIIG